MEFPPNQRFFDVIKSIRNRLRQYNAFSVIDLCLKELWASRAATRVDGLKAAPWHLMLIAKVVLEDVRIPLEAGPVCTPQVLHACRQRLWECPPLDPIASNANVWMMLRALMYPQLGFQQPLDWTFLRWPAIVAELPPSNPSRSLFVQAMGMEPEVFAGLAWITYVPALNGEHFISRADYTVANLIFGDSIPRFLGLFAASLETLRVTLHDELDERVRSGQPPRRQQELHEFPWLSRFPLLSLRNERFAIWHPHVLARGMEDAPHRLMAMHGQTYTQVFSKEFERYVVSIIEEVGFHPVTDGDFKKLGNASLSAVDAILPFEDANVFVEAKMSIFDDEVILGDVTGVIFNKLRKVREAIVQAWRVGALLRNGTLAIANCSAAKRDFLIVVTSRQLYCNGGEKMKQLLGAGVFDRMTDSAHGRPTEAQIKYLPARNIVVVSIAEFEHLMGAAGDGLIDLPGFLREVGEASTDGSRSRMFIDQYLEAKKPERWWVPSVQKRLRERIQTRFESMV